MSRFMLKVALAAGLLVVGARFASAALFTYGAYGSQEQAAAAGQGEIDRGAADSYGAGYQPDDPEGKGRGPGYCVTVHYPDAPPSPPVGGDDGGDEGGLLGVPFPR